MERVSGRLLRCLFKEQPVCAPYFISASEQLLESTWLMWSHLSACHAPLMRKYFIDSVLGSGSSFTPSRQYVLFKEGDSKWWPDLQNVVAKGKGATKQVVLVGCKTGGEGRNRTDGIWLEIRLIWHIISLILMSFIYRVLDKEHLSMSLICIPSGISRTMVNAPHRNLRQVASVSCDRCLAVG